MASKKMKLYYWPMYRSVRVIWLIKEMGVESDFELVPFQPGQDADADAAYRRDVHPHCTIPALVIPGGRTMLESGAICLYLADLYGKLVPEPKERRDYYDFAMYGKANLDELIGFYYMCWEMKKDYPQDKKDRMKAKWRTCMLYLTNHLEGQDYLCGEDLTAADCIVGYNLYLAALMNDGQLLKEHPDIMNYVKRLQSRPAYQYAVNMKE